jgi:hypothetical protein
MKRRDFNRIVLGIGLCPLLTKFVGAQAIEQTETFAQAPTNGVTEISTNDPMAAVREYIDAFNKGDVKTMAAIFAVPGSILDGMAPRGLEMRRSLNQLLGQSSIINEPIVLATISAVPS